MTPGGELATFEHAYRAQGAYVADVLGRLAVPSEAVGDAVQDVFVAAYRRWNDFDPERPVRPWLTAFARRVAFRYRRSAARRYRKGAALVHVQSDQGRPHDHEIEARDFLGRFLGELDEGHRDAFLMMELEGRTAAEVANVLGISAEAVFGRVRSVRRRLRQALVVEAREPDPRAAALVPAWAIMKARLGLVIPAILLPGVGSVSVASVKTFGLTVVLGVAVLGLVGVASPRDEGSPKRTPAAIASPAPRIHEETHAASAAPIVLPAREPDAIAHDAIAPAPPVVVAPAEPARRSTRIAAPMPAPTPSSRTGGLEQETALLQSAKVALTEGRPKAALAELEVHAERFPDGQLADARRRTRIRALCDLGHVREAQAEAQAFARTRPRDPLAREALSICAGPPIQQSGPAEKDDTK